MYSIPTYKNVSSFSLSFVLFPAKRGIGGQPPLKSLNMYNETPQDNCSALARHLFAHVRNIPFRTKAEVAEWCRTNISVEIIWRSSTLGLVKTAGQKSCRLCADECLIIGQSITGSLRRQQKILNLKSEMRGVCSCKKRLLRFARSA